MLQQLRRDTDLEKSSYLEKQLEWKSESKETGELQSKRGIKGRNY